MNIVTGPGRSGTSMVANLLLEMGLNFGPSSLFLPADQWNERGYFENTEIISLNISLITTNLFNPKYRAMDPIKHTFFTRTTMNLQKVIYLLPLKNRRIVKKAESIKKDIESLCCKYKNITIKDPRFTLTIGQWIKHGNIGKALFCYRNPYDVAVSLNRAYHAPMPLAFWIWKDRVVEFFRQIKDVNLVIVNYNNFFKSSTAKNEMKRLYEFAEREFIHEEAEYILGKIVDKRKKHSSGSETKLPRKIRSILKKVNTYHEIYSTLKPFHGSLEG